jgi:dinuclear metal center YbgI/SA1388 family protein
MVMIKEIAEFLNQELDIYSFKDSSNNGLQVENEGEINKIGFAVDVSLETFQKASSAGCQMLIVHHGLIWEGIKYIKGNNYQRIKCLINNNLALYAVHLPLDANNKYGNNAKLAEILGLENLKAFGYMDGQAIGFIGEVNTTLEQIKQKMRDNGMNDFTFAYGKSEIKKVAIVAGAFSAGAFQASAANADVYVTGEKKYGYQDLAKEAKMNIICGDHYATEVWGVKALMPLLKEKFNVEVEFIDNPIPI